MHVLRRDGGFAAGGEMLAFGALVFVVGTLLVMSAWQVVDTKYAVSAAAREATRAYVESDSASAARDRADGAARASLAAHGVAAPEAAQVAVAGSFERCATVTSTVRYRVPPVALPWVGGIGAVEVVGAHAELVDPLRSGVPGTAGCITGPAA